ncbi:MAG: HAD family hydrolase [Bryocella sp.]
MKLIAIDMDGTLLGSDGRVSERNRAALLGAEAAGIEVVIATGRRHCYAMHVLEEVGLRQGSALVSSNGTVVRTLGAELLQRTHMELDVARALCAHMQGFRKTLVLTFDCVGADGEDTRGAIVVEDLPALEAAIGRWVSVNEEYIAEVRPLEKALEGEPPIQMMLCGSLEQMEEAQALMLELPWVTAMDEGEVEGAKIVLHRTVYPARNLCLLDVLPAGCSKASALREVADSRGIAMSEVMAIGDNWNDVPMLEAAGRAVVMANAPTELIALAVERGWRVGLSNDEDGVAEAVEEVLREANEAVPVIV